MAILTENEAKQILDKVIKLSKADECSATLSGSNEGNIRYARNTVSTSGYISDVSLAVTCSFGKKSGSATINEFDDASLEKVVRRAEELAKLSPENPEYMPMVGKQTYKPTAAYANATAEITPEYRAQAAANSIEPAKKNKIVAAGFLTDSAGFQAIANSKGVFGYTQATNVDFTVTMRTEDGTGSGWVRRNYNDVSQLNTATASKIAIDKAAGSRGAKALEPGRYTVILEPDAAVGLITPLVQGFNQRSADEGRSFMSKKGGGTKLGEKMFDERVNLYSDPWDEECPGAPWAGDFTAQQRIEWIKKGVAQNMITSRFWAEKTKKESIPFPSNLIMVGGDKTTEELIKSTRRGILVTRTWYIRPVDPQTALYTGLTRDGTFYIENGEIKYPVKNFRFNESPIKMLNNIEELGKSMRTAAFGQFAIKMPAMKIRDFEFTSLSDAV